MAGIFVLPHVKGVTNLPVIVICSRVTGFLGNNLFTSAGRLFSKKREGNQHMYLGRPVCLANTLNI